MCDVTKVLRIAEDYFKKDETPVSIGAKYKTWNRNHTNTNAEETVLIGGRIEWNPYHHRRDAFDVLVKYNMWFKQLPNGFYEAGSHCEHITETRVGVTPTAAITDMAYFLLS